MLSVQPDAASVGFETVPFPKMSRDNETKRSYANLNSSKQAWLQSNRTFPKRELRSDNPKPESLRDIKLTQFFNLYDKDGSGTVSYDELKAALKLESEGEFTDEEFRCLMDESDADSSQSLDLPEFKQMIVKFRKMQQEKSAAQLPRHTLMKLHSKKITSHHLLCNGMIRNFPCYEVASNILTSPCRNFVLLLCPCDIIFPSHEACVGSLLDVMCSLEDDFSRAS